MRGLEKRIRKLESVLPPLLTEDDSWDFAVLWFAVAYYLGNPAPEKPFAAFARALGYADQSELEAAMEAPYRDLAEKLYSAIGRKQNGLDPLVKDRVRAKSDTVDPYRDLAVRLYRAEERVLVRFGIYLSSLEYRDVTKFWKALIQMMIGLPQSYKDRLWKMVLGRGNHLAWMRVHSDDVAPYIRCFA